MKKWHEIVITVVIILILLLLSFAFLKLPKLYFRHSDEKLNGVVSIGAYDINNEIRSMSVTQLLDVLEKEDVLMVEEEAPVLDKELYDKLIAGTLREFLLLIFDESHEFYVYTLTGFVQEGAAYTSSAYTILEVEEDEIYSARVGALSLEYNMDGYKGSFHIDIVFNLETYDILGISLNDMTPYGVEDFWICLNRWDVLIENLNQYYGVELSWDNLLEGMIESKYLRVVPWDYETEMKKILRTLISSMFETGYEYVELMEMLQE